MFLSINVDVDFATTFVNHPPSQKQNKTKYKQTKPCALFHSNF